MDFVTHTLLGAGVARFAARTRDQIPQLTLAGILGALLMDGDSWLYLIGPEYYGRYHRVATHSLVGLVAMAVVSGLVAWAILRVRAWRRFGWFVADNLPREAEPPPRPSPALLIGVAGIATLTHLAGDFITGYGNIMPLWPWSWWDASRAWVNSFDWVLFSSALAWHVALRTVGTTRRRDLLITASWLGVVVVYIAIRAWAGRTAVW